MDTILEDMTVSVVPTVAEPYAGGRRVMDADSHVMEPPGWVEAHADARTRELLRPVDFPESIQNDVQKALDDAERRANDPAAYAEAEQAILSAKRWFALGAWERDERAHAMDILGFESQLVFPTHGKSQFLGDDVELLVGGHRALNRAMNAFCADDPRLVSVASVPWLDEETTMSILTEAMDGGAGAAMVQAVPGDVSPTHPQYAGVWATLEERGIPFVLHINGRVRPMNPSFFSNGHDAENPWGNNVRGKEYMASHHPPEDFLSALVLDGVFETHPRLMGGCIELSGVWVASWMRRLDHCQEMWGRGDDTLARPAHEAVRVRAAKPLLHALRR